VRWVKNEGDAINKGDVLAEIETDKATVEVESSASGVVRKLLASPGDSVPVGAAIAVIGAEGEVVEIASTASDQSPATTAQTAAPVSSGASVAEALPVAQVLSSEIKASPLARKVARERSVDLRSVKGTGPGGRIVRRDIEAALASPSVEAKSQPALAPAVTAPRALAPADETVQTTKLRQAIGRRLVESKTSIPHFYVSHEYKMEALMELRQQINGVLPEGEKLSVNDFIVKAVALALRQFPNLNASLAGDKIIRYGAVNVGVAVTVPGGLMTVVVKDTDRKPLRQISTEVKAMAARAREGKVKPEDVDGSTFSTSNLGMYDVDEFIAIINPPEAAILAIGSAREVPVVVRPDGQAPQLVPGWRMKATISVDHRISDGSEAAQFMQALARVLEEPLRLLV